MRFPYRRPVILLLAVISFANSETINSNLVVENLDRQIDASSQLVKIQNKLTLANEGSSAVKDFLFAVEPQLGDKVSFIGATVGSSDKTYLRVAPTKVESKPDVSFWKISLKDALSAGRTQTVEVEVILGKSLQMFPEQITQREKQLVVLNGNHYAFLPYKVKTQTTKVSLSSNNIESYSKLKPVSQSESTVTYGPYNNIEPFSQDEMSIHYENNNPFLVVSRIERLIEVSMWGNIAIEETIDIRHAGAKLKGPFSRYEYQRESSGVSSVKSFKTVLPAAASDVYYRDDIGNISTSALRNMDDAVELDIKPRFPLFGGWKTHYLIGYNVPSYEYLYKNGDDFVLNMRVVDHIYDDMLVEDFELKIILPEGAQVGKLSTPYPMSRGKDSLHYTYLDTTGRPVILIKSVGDLTERHIQDFQLEFKYPRMTMIREPLLLIMAYFIFFFLAIIYVRLDFAITKDEGSEAKMKVAGYCEKVHNHQDKRSDCYTKFDDALVKLKSTKDTINFQNTLKKINADHKTETQAIADLNAIIKGIAPDTGEKIAELQRLDRSFRDHQSTQSALVEKLVTGKLGKPQFIEQEAVINKKKDEAIEKMNAIMRTL